MIKYPDATVSLGDIYPITLKYPNNWVTEDDIVNFVKYRNGILHTENILIFIQLN